MLVTRDRIQHIASLACLLVFPSIERIRSLSRHTQVLHLYTCFGIIYLLLAFPLPSPLFGLSRPDFLLHTYQYNISYLSSTITLSLYPPVVLHCSMTF